jgi:hypothetical protein
MSARSAIGLSAVLLAAASPALAQTPAPEVQPPPGEVEAVTVFGRRSDDIGRALSASEGEVVFSEFEDRPLLRPGELVEVVPGMAATQHSGTGKANQFFLRGFNLDHGTDFSVSLDGAPLNLRSHAHGQGYLDLNGLIPELVEAVGYRKGVYAADVGDFSSAGSAAFETFDTAPATSIEVTIGENDYGRALGVTGLGGVGYVAAELTRSDGPWERPENLEKVAGLGRFTLGDWSLTALAHDAQWDSTDQIPQRAIDAGLLSRFGVVDPSDGGETSRFILTARRRSENGWNASVYAQKYDLNLWSNFTYFLSDPERGDQFEQADDRWIYGGSLSRRLPEVAGWSLRGGAQVRYDDIAEVGLYLTQGRARFATIREDSIEQLSGAIWAEAARAFGPLRIQLGLRGEAMNVDVRSDNSVNSGSADDAVLSPKFSAAWRVSPTIELYGNLGRGFHSNDARGATISVDPLTGEPVDPVELYAESSGGEIGARYSRPGLNLAAAIWALDLESELVYVGDAGATEAAGATRRIGLELLADWTPHPLLHLDFSGAVTEAAFKDDPPGGDRIPLAVEYVVTGGLSARLMPDTTATVTVRRLGPAALIEDGSVGSEPSTLTNLLLHHDIGRVSLGLEVLNVFDQADDDIQYFYASRLPGEPDEGVEDRHVHPFEPRTLRLSLRLRL